MGADPPGHPRRAWEEWAADVAPVTVDVLTSDSTLRFRGRDEVEASLVAQGYRVRDVREAPDRPGREFVFLAERPPRQRPR